MSAVLRALVAAFKVALAIGLLAWLILSFGSQAVLEHLVRADPLSTAAAVAAIVGNLWLRAWRWRPLLAVPRPSVRAAFAAIAGGYLFNNLLPARVGDAVRVLVLASLGGLRRAPVLASVLVERVFDLCFACALLVGVTRLRPLEPWLDYGPLVVGGGALAGLSVLVVLAIFRERASRVAGIVLVLLPPNLAALIARIAEGFLDGIRDVMRVRPMVAFWSITAVLWMTEALVVQLVARAIGIEITFVDTLIVMLVAVFASFMPTVPGQIGVFEAAVVAGMSSLGFAPGAAFALAVLWHMLVLLVTSLVGAASLFAERHALGVPLASLRAWTNDRLAR